MSRLLKFEESKERRMNMVVDARDLLRIEVKADIELAEKVLDELGYSEMAMLFNDEKILTQPDERNWNDKMVQRLNENGRKHIKKLYDMVCEWYEANPEDAEAEGYTEW